MNCKGTQTLTFPKYDYHADAEKWKPIVTFCQQAGIEPHQPDDDNLTITVRFPLEDGTFVEFSFIDILITVVDYTSQLTKDVERLENLWARADDSCEYYKQQLDIRDCRD